MLTPAPRTAIRFLLFWQSVSSEYFVVGVDVHRPRPVIRRLEAGASPPGWCGAARRGQQFHRAAYQLARNYELHLHKAFETAIDHPLAIERRLRFRIHHLFEPRIRHHLGVDLVALGARLVGDPGEYDGFARLQLDAARKRGELADLDIVGDPFAVIERAVFAPDLAGLFRQLGISREIFFGTATMKPS